MRRGGGRQGGRCLSSPRWWGWRAVCFSIGIRLEGRCSSSFLQGHPPSLRFGHPDVTFGRHRPSARPSTIRASRCTFRKRHQGTLSGALRSEARRERSTREGGFPCRSVGRCAPAASRRNANDAFLKRFSVRSYPAAHSREREPNAPRSAPPPASNQRQRQPQRCRCAPPARAPPNRQCR